MRKNHGNSVTLVLGGVRSGKSRYAQQLAEPFPRVTFVATAEPRQDEEMRRKIERHRASRPAHWTTVEERLALGRVVHASEEDCDALLIDCLTLFAANLLEAFGGEAHGGGTGLETCIDELCAALETTSCRVILVSNEVGSGVVPAYELGRRFRDVLGAVNQRVAAVADTVVLMVAGLPLVLKGSLAGEHR